VILPITPCRHNFLGILLLHYIKRSYFVYINQSKIFELQMQCSKLVTEQTIIENMPLITSYVKIISEGASVQRGLVHDQE